MPGPGWGGGGHAELGAARQQTALVGGATLGSWVPSLSLLILLPESSMGRVGHRLNLGSSFREKRNQRSPQGSFIHVRSIY